MYRRGAIVGYFTKRRKSALIYFCSEWKKPPSEHGVRYEKLEEQKYFAKNNQTKSTRVFTRRSRLLPRFGYSIDRIF